MTFRHGKYRCDETGCKAAFTDQRSAKSHPWAAHKIRSASPEAAARRRRREAANPDIEAAVDFLRAAGFRVSWPRDGRDTDEKRVRLERETSQR